MLMMPPPPARRNSGTAYLHITKAPVRLTAMALFQSSSESVSTVPSGVTVAATLTSVVSLPKRATVRSTASLALASSAASAGRHRGRAPPVATAGAPRPRPGWGGGGGGVAAPAPPRGEAPKAPPADLATAAGDQCDP